MLRISDSWLLSITDRLIGSEERRRSWEEVYVEVSKSNYIQTVEGIERIKTLIFNIMVDIGAKKAKEKAKPADPQLLHAGLKLAEDKALSFALKSISVAIGGSLGIDSIYIDTLLDSDNIKPALKNKLAEGRIVRTLNLMNALSSAVKITGLNEIYFKSLGEIYAKEAEAEGEIDNLAQSILLAAKTIPPFKYDSINPLRVGFRDVFNHLINNIALYAISIFASLDLLKNHPEKKEIAIYEKMNLYLDTLGKYNIDFKDLSSSLGIKELTETRYHGILTTSIEVSSQVADTARTVATYLNPLNYFNNPK